MGEETAAVQAARGLEEIYRNFTESVKELGSKHGGRGKLGASVMHWLAGSHVKTQRDLLCEQFLADVQSQLRVFDSALEDAGESDVREACAVVADILTTSVPPGSNGTTDLMKRAMVGQLKPYLAKLSPDKLKQVKEKIEAAYPKRQRLPVEMDILKEINTLLKSTGTLSAG